MPVHGHTVEFHPSVVSTDCYWASIVERARIFASSSQDNFCMRVQLTIRYYDSKKSIEYRSAHKKHGKVESVAVFDATMENSVAPRICGIPESDWLDRQDPVSFCNDVRLGELGQYLQLARNLGKSDGTQ